MSARKTAFLLGLATLLSPMPLAGQINPWLNARVDSLVAVRLGLRDAAKQPLPVAASSGNASLIDRSSMPDVVGISVDLSGQPANGTSVPTAVSLSGNPFYLIAALIQGEHPLDPKAYLGSALARRFGLNVTFDTDEDSGETVTLGQLKIKFLDRGDPLDAAEDFTEALENAADAYGALRRTVEDIFWDRYGKANFPEDRKVDFINDLTRPDEFDLALAGIGSAGVNEINRGIEAKLDEFVTLRRTVRQVISRARARPELALGVTGRLGDAIDDEFRAVLIFDWAPSWFDLTVNAGTEYVRGSATTPDLWRVQAAAQFMIYITPDSRLYGRTPMTFTLAASGTFATDETDDSRFRVQARLMLPIGDGVNVPISFTWANRTDLIDEDEVRGHIGFTFDVGQLFAAVR